MAASTPHILWDWGTAFDLFASLHVLHYPETFGLRPSWAAGVRSRLTGAQRNILEDAQKLFFSSPLAWVSSLPEPKDANTALSSLGQIPPARRLPTLAQHADAAADLLTVLHSVLERGAWDDHDLQQLQQHPHSEKGRVDKEELVKTLNWWSHPEEFGDRYLAALQAYVAVFFAEEEQRIKPYLQQALTRAQDLAARLDFSNLFIELSQGVKIATMEEAEEVTFVPSYWTTPLVMYDCVIKDRWVVLFGARPPQAALVPGDLVPDALLRSLKALSDPTRLLILRYLSDQPLTPSQLARKLRLRPPTVIHHLNTLRLAGLVYVTLEEQEEKRYMVRAPAIAETFAVLNNFMNNEGKA
ncbi:MAG TPA: winged helix-turn-helix domain-containing protein [Anaerolineales bacterium]|nr:winged helix-turn-helix domain-containing protein [Anaerolineales bacterium]